MRAPDGGYGTPVPRKDQVEINSVPRHTAMGAVSHLLFSSRGSPAALAAHLAPTVKWLLDNELNKGGWPYDQATRPAVGYLSTASAICALCLFLDLDHPVPELAEPAKIAISRGYTALAADARDGIWIGDGTPPDAQIANSAFALNLLWIANRSGRLTDIAGAPALEELIAAFSTLASREGWPEMVGSQPAPVSTVSALQLVLETGNPGKLKAALITSIENSVLAAWNNGSLAAQMTSWDWQCAATLAATYAGPLSRSDSEALVNDSEDIRRVVATSELRAANLANLNAKARAAAVFALTGGRGINVPLARRARVWGKGLVPKFVERALWALIAIVALTLFYLLFGTDPSGFIERLFQR